jgi:hypothetical protein
MVRSLRIDMDAIYDFISRIDEGRMQRDLFHLAKDPLPFRKLNYIVPGHGHNTLYEADEWIEEELRNYGYSVEREACDVQAFGFDATKPKAHSYAPPPAGAPSYVAYNLYARKTGKGHPEEIILLVAHKDSQSWIDSPGAYDNGVGTVGVLEIARALAGYASHRSVWFLFCNEEHTPWTSIAAAHNMRQRGENLISIFNLDALGGKGDEDIALGRKTNVTLYTTPEGKRFADLMARVNEEYRIGLVQSSYQRPYPNDDDGSFVKAGYGCAIANIGSFPYSDAQYHLEGDVPERVDIANVRMATQSTLAAVLWIDQGITW